MDVLKVSVIPSDKHLLSCHSAEKVKRQWDNPSLLHNDTKKTLKMIHKVYFSKNCHRHTKYLNQHNFKAFLTWLVFVGTKCQS